MSGSTEIGGSQRAFQTTRWTEIMDLKDAGQEQRRQAMGRLLLNYWKPVYSYLRRRGYDSERAKDLTQGFFTAIVLEKQLVDKADRQRGRFRNFLLKALNHYVYNVTDYENAHKRSPKLGCVSLDHVDPSSVPDPSGYGTPEDAYNYTWAAEFLRKVCDDVREACYDNDLSRHWAVFNGRVLEPILSRQDPPSLPTLCAELGITDEKQAANMIGVVKKRFKATMRRHLSHLVETEAEIEEEYHDLLAVFSRN